MTGVATFGGPGQFLPTSDAIRVALELGYRKLVWNDDIDWTSPICMDEFPGDSLSIFAPGGPLTTCAHRKYTDSLPCLYSTRKDLWRLHWTGISFIDDRPDADKPGAINRAPFVRFPRIDRSWWTLVGFYGCRGVPFELGGDGDDEYVSALTVLGLESHQNVSGGFMGGTRKLRMGVGSTVERCGSPLLIVGDRDASGDSTIRDMNLEHDDGRPQLEIHGLTNSKIEDIRLDEAALVGRDCTGTTPRDLKLHGASSVDWPGAPWLARRTWKRIPRNARGV